MADQRDCLKTHNAIWTTRMDVKTKRINEIWIPFISRRGSNLRGLFIATCLRTLRVTITVVMIEMIRSLSLQRELAEL